MSFDPKILSGFCASTSDTAFVRICAPDTILAMGNDPKPAV